LSGRSWAATAFLEFAPGRFHRHDQFGTPMFRQPVLENFHERLLFFHGQLAGGIHNLRKLCHGWNLASGRTLGNHVFLHTPRRQGLPQARIISCRSGFACGLMILSGHDFVGSSGLGFCKSGKLGESRFAFVAAIAPRVAPERIVSYAFCRFTHSQSQL
jgi:hypothetical protein